MPTTLFVEETEGKRRCSACKTALAEKELSFASQTSVFGVQGGKLHAHLACADMSMIKKMMKTLATSQDLSDEQVTGFSKLDGGAQATVRQAFEEIAAGSFNKKRKTPTKGKAGNKAATKKRKVAGAPRAPGKVKKASSFYYQELKNELKTENPDLTNSQLKAAITERWEALSDEEKKPYVDKEVTDMIRFEKAEEVYKEKLEAWEAKKAAEAAEMKDEEAIVEEEEEEVVIKKSAPKSPKSLKEAAKKKKDNKKMVDDEEGVKAEDDEETEQSDDDNSDDSSDSSSEDEDASSSSSSDEE